MEEEQGKNEEDKGKGYEKYQFNVSSEAYANYRVLAAHKEISMAELGRIALEEYVTRASLIKEEEEFANLPAKSKAERKAAVIKAMRKKYHIELAVVLASKGTDKEITVAEVQSYLEKDEKFARDFHEAQNYFVAAFEMNPVFSMIANKKNEKDRFLFWQSFQNAHNPYHGRVKAELISREMMSFIDEAYKVIEENFGPTQANNIKKQIKEKANKRLVKYT
jgi:hypothetical protein